MLADMVSLIKQIAMDAFNASNPSSVVFGKVESVNPLRINVEQKMVLTSEFLVLTNAVRDHYIEMTVDHRTDITSLNANHSHTSNSSFEGTAETRISNTVSPPSTTVSSQAQTEVSGTVDTQVNDVKINLDHSHSYSGRKRFLIHNGLKTGEGVILLQIQGGQKFIVMERVV